MDSKFSNILLNKLPKKINNTTEDILDVLFTINEIVRELNSVDFCNPLGYILTKALPPGGFIDTKLKQYGEKVTNFINKNTELDLSDNNDLLAEKIEETRLLLETLLIEEELKDIIPNADTFTKLIQDLNDVLVISNSLTSLNNKKILLKSLSNRLIPFSNPISLTELLISSQADKLNLQIKKTIKPERFRDDLLKLIKLVTKIDKSITNIKNIILLIKKIIKSITVLINLLKISISLLKSNPTPAQFTTIGVTTTSSFTATKFDNNITDFQKILNTINDFISNSVITQITRIREQIFILLIGLNQLYENLKSCSYFKNDMILGIVENGIITLNNNIILLEELFPSIKNSNLDNIYKNYKIIIDKETTTDNNTTLFRRRVLVYNENNIIEYEGTPTYATNDQILITEGRFFIDSLNNNDVNENNENEELNKQYLQNIEDQKEINDLLLLQIKSNPQSKKIFDKLNKNEDNIDKIVKIIKSIKITDPIKFRIRLNQLTNSLLQKGYTQYEIQEAIKIYNKN